MKPPASRKRAPCASAAWLARSELNADHQVQPRHGDDEREVAPADDPEVRAALLDDLARHVDVLALDAPAVAHLVALLEDALGAHASRERVREPALARDHDDAATLGRQQPPELREGRGQVRQVLEHVDRERAVERAVRERQPLRAVARHDLDAGMALFDPLRQLGPELDGDVAFARELRLCVEVLAEPGTDLDRALSGARGLRRPAVVEALDRAVAVRQDLVPVGHEVVAHADLLGRELRQDLRPLRGGHQWITTTLLPVTAGGCPLASSSGVRTSAIFSGPLTAPGGRSFGNTQRSGRTPGKLRSKAAG